MLQAKRVPRASHFVSLALVTFVFNGCATLSNFVKPQSSSPCPGEGCPVAANTISSNGTDVSNDTAAVWFPFSWTLETPQKIEVPGAQPLSEFKLRDISLLLSNTQNKKRQAIPFLSLQNSANVVLDTREPARTFFLPSLFSLPEGEYSIEGVTARYVPSNDGQGGDYNVSRDVVFPFSNIFSEKSDEPLIFSARKGKIAILPRISMLTRVHSKGKSLGHVSETEAKDRDFIPTDIPLQQVGKGYGSAARMFAAARDFPRLRTRLTASLQPQDQIEPAAARIGMIFDIPCDFQGQYRLIWKRAGDEKEYFAALEVPSKNDNSCGNLRKIPLQFIVPKGEWHLLATYFSKGSSRDSFKIPSAAQRDAAYRDYFRMREEDESVNWWGREQDIKRKIGFTVKEGSFNPDTIHYAGRLGLSVSGSDADKPGSLATLWDRRYSVDELKNIFNAKDVLNAFSLSPLVRNQTKDQVQSILRVQSARPNLADPFATEFRKRATEMFAQCVIEREQIDPLISVSGTLAFSIVKTTNYIDFEKLDIASDKESTLWVRDCVERKLRSFRFQDKVPVRISGELQFQLE